MLKIRVDARTPRPVLWDFHGIPLATEYKYLGITITDTLKFKLHNQILETKERELNHYSWLLGDPKLDSKARWHMF